ncbi:ATP-binding protein [Streptomyces sp. Ru87]|uniref:ATP-binding protein n=1 Tax=Streptomyces sp. Ru87 TaxID=2044307 RepID=UPI00211D8F06|nr:ATP-binding protein [Streptomyces sp. Ru87]
MSTVETADRMAARAHAPPDSWEYSLQLPRDPLAPRIARCTVRTVLGEHGLVTLAETAELLTSELVTNAYLHSPGPASVRLKWHGEKLRVSVWDSSTSRPRPAAGLGRGTNPFSERGRGLLLVAVCADDWGSFPLGEDLAGVRGKVVWFALDAGAADRAPVPRGGRRG